MAKFAILDREGYHDGWYWDYRLLIEVDDKKYVYMDMGSCSGWIAEYEGIIKLENEEEYSNFLHDWNGNNIGIEAFDSDVDITEEYIRPYIEELEKLEEKEFCIYDEDGGVNNR